MKTTKNGFQVALMIGSIMFAKAAIAQVPTISQRPTEQKEVGLKVGATAPLFKARDQQGREQTLSSLAGPKGLVLLFVRSADW